jgi:hypothetical protein
MFLQRRSTPHRGGSGIRTHGTQTGTTVFETVRFGHSRIPPWGTLVKPARPTARRPPWPSSPRPRRTAHPICAARPRRTALRRRGAPPPHRAPRLQSAPTPTAWHGAATSHRPQTARRSRRRSSGPGVGVRQSSLTGYRRVEWCSRPVHSSWLRSVGVVDPTQNSLRCPVTSSRGAARVLVRVRELNGYAAPSSR